MVREIVGQGCMGLVWSGHGKVLIPALFFFLRNYLFCGGRFLFVLFSCIARHERSQFPDQGLKPCPLQWKHSVLTTGSPGKSQLGGASGKEPACQCHRHKRCEFDPWVRKIPWTRAWQPTTAFLPEQSYGQRSLVPTIHEVTNDPYGPQSRT